MTALKQLAEILKARLKRDDTLVFVYGNFNILHPGHVRLLQFAKSNGTFLLVGITPDGTPGTSIEAEMRLESIRAIGIVDLAFVIEDSVLDVIKMLKPEIVAKGKEHKSRSNPELAILEILRRPAAVQFGRDALHRSEHDRSAIFGRTSRERI